MQDEERRPNPIDVHVGERVAIYRRLAGLSQEALGHAIGVTFQQVQKYEKGTNRIGASRLFGIARTLDVPLPVLFDGLLEQPSDPNVSGVLPVHAVSRQGIELMRAFAAIEDRRTRDLLLALACRIAVLSHPTADAGE